MNINWNHSKGTVIKQTQKEDAFLRVLNSTLFLDYELFTWNYCLDPGIFYLSVLALNPINKMTSNFTFPLEVDSHESTAIFRQMFAVDKMH